MDKRKSAISMLQKIKGLEEQSKVFEEQKKEIDIEKIKAKDKEIKDLKAKILDLQIMKNAEETKVKKAEQSLEKMKIAFDKTEH